MEVGSVNWKEFSRYLVCYILVKERELFVRWEDKFFSVFVLFFVRYRVFLFVGI